MPWMERTRLAALLVACLLAAGAAPPAAAATTYTTLTFSEVHARLGQLQHCCMPGPATAAAAATVLELPCRSTAPAARPPRVPRSRLAPADVQSVFGGSCVTVPINFNSANFRYAAAYVAGPMPPGCSSTDLTWVLPARHPPARSCGCPTLVAKALPLSSLSPSSPLPCIAALPHPPLQNVQAVHGRHLQQQAQQRGVWVRRQQRHRPPHHLLLIHRPLLLPLRVC